MKNKFKVAFALVLIASIFAATPVLAKGMVPFKAQTIAVAGPAPIGAPPWAQDVYGSGVATHMGKVSVYQHHYVAPTSDPNILNFYDGTFSWTAANGDKLTGTYSGYLQLNVAGFFEIHGQFIIDGGTGRFQHPTGGGQASGAQHLDGTANLTLNGLINY